MRDVPPALMAVFPPSLDLLLDRARRWTDDAMLKEIAVADYGMGADEAMAELRPIRDRGVIPASMSWVLHEVLTLTQYSDPDAPDAPPFQPGPAGRRGHQTRLFACAVLLRAGAEASPEENFTSDSALAQCLVSANVVGNGMSEAAASFLTWRLSRRDGDPASLSPLFAVGLLILATRLRPERLAETDIGTIADWVIAQDSFDSGEFSPYHPNPRPLPFSLCMGFWEPLATELRAGAEAIRDEDVRTRLQLCELLLNPGW